MPHGWHRARTQSRMQVNKEEETIGEEVMMGGGKKTEKVVRLIQYMLLLCFLCVLPTSEVLTRPSWKEQLEGSWVHRLRYLHQWQRKALFTHDRHLHGPHAEWESQEKKNRQHSQGGMVRLPTWRRGGAPRRKWVQLLSGHLLLSCPCTWHNL